MATLSEIIIGLSTLVITPAVLGAIAYSAGRIIGSRRLRELGDFCLSLAALYAVPIAAFLGVGLVMWAIMTTLHGWLP